MNGSSPVVIANAIHHALTSEKPRSRYRVGKHAPFLATLVAFVPDLLLEMSDFTLSQRFGSLSATADQQPIKRAA